MNLLYYHKPSFSEKVKKQFVIFPVSCPDSYSSCPQQNKKPDNPEMYFSRNKKDCEEIEISSQSLLWNGQTSSRSPMI